MKQKHITQAGFTLIELLVVLSMMTLLMTAIVINFNVTRAARSAVLAQNETITNIRKAQSDMLSSRDVPVSGAGPAKFYVVRFEANKTQYKIQAIDNSYQLYDIETVTLPGEVKVGAFTDGSLCLEVLFAAPFGKMYLNPDPACTENVAAIAQNPITLYGLNDQTMALTLVPTNGAASKSISLHSLTGRIDAD